MVTVEQAAVQHLMDRLIERSGRQPDLVYHYTTDSGLLGIIREKCLWATDIRYLNDSKELHYTLELASGHLQQLQRGTYPEQEANLLEEWHRAISNVQRFPVYVAAFSRHQDKLSQWRAYGRGTGYAIGFTPQVLWQATIGFTHIGAWFRCVYSKDEQLDLLNEATTHLLEAFRSTKIPDPPDDVTHRMGFEIAFFYHLFTLAACFKHPSFEEEDEWRLVFQEMRSEKQIPHRHLREGRRMIVPYLKVPLTLKDGTLRLDELIVGPTPHKDLAVEAVRLLLDQEGVVHDGVKPSETPFRDW